MSLLPLEDARRRLLAGCTPLTPLAVPLDEALDLVTSAAVVAEESVPPFANTAMDGFAVRAADTAGAPVVLDVVGTLAAGAPPDVVVGAGQAVRIMTGAPMPPGADAVVMVERTEAVDGGAAVRIGVAAELGEHVRAAGEDIRPGQEVFPAGTVLGPGHLGVLASLGYRKVAVVRRPRVGVLSTGDELVDGPEPLQPGQIRDSNRHSLLALVGTASCQPVDLGVVRDDEDAIARALQTGIDSCDAVLTSGGVSVGDFDYVKVVLDRLSGGRMQWVQVAIRPAKPLAFGTVGEVPVIGLPGNPVSSMVSFELFARPALRRLMGHPDPVPQPEPAVAGEDLPRRPDGKVHFVRVTSTWGDDGRRHVRSAGGQASNLLLSMALADALAVLPDGSGVAAGDPVGVLPVRAWW